MRGREQGRAPALQEVRIPSMAEGQKWPPVSAREQRAPLPHKVERTPQGPVRQQ